MGAWNTEWGLMAELGGLPAMGALYCLGADWSRWRPLDFPGTHLPYSTMQLIIFHNGKKMPRFDLL